MRVHEGDGVPSGEEENETGNDEEASDIYHRVLGSETGIYGPWGRVTCIDHRVVSEEGRPWGWMLVAAVVVEGVVGGLRSDPSAQKGNCLTPAVHRCQTKVN